MNATSSQPSAKYKTNVPSRTVHNGLIALILQYPVREDDETN